FHIDMFDDRLEITSPGGMFGGGSIQEYDIYRIRSMRRNPVIADLFHRMKYMERRGSGLRKIISETEKLPGYTTAYKPEFSSTATDFRVILKNVNYIMCGASVHDAAHDAAHDTSVINKQNLLLEFCVEPKSRDKMQAYIEVSSRSHFSQFYLKPLLASGKLEMMIPDKPKSKNQKYITVRTE
ncbi:MAG TPA: AAA family ATPase, partial [Lachnospiraceae bacterium]|nr:AAA family ATPase [Lachnospiraceae bacterium]